MTKTLKSYFPMIHTQQEILAEINSNKKLQTTFYSWRKEQQAVFLDFCTGVRGVKVLYDFMFKEIFNPETEPARLEALLSCLLEQNIHIRSILPNDSTRLADETVLLITDIVVELDCGEICNVEVQKIGYAFPGQRSACYSADLLLRQYKRVRDEKRESFHYRDINQVYTIVFFEKSPAEFHAFPDSCIHRFEQASNTGLKLNLLQKYLFISLDIAQKIYQNKNITSQLTAWLTFLSTDDPERIISLIEAYPEFKPLYRHIYDICQNTENIMGLFSEELLQMDRNTAKYMIDEQQAQIDKQRAQIDSQLVQIDKQKAQISSLNEKLNEKDLIIAKLQEQLKKQ